MRDSRKNLVVVALLSLGLTAGAKEESSESKPSFRVEKLRGKVVPYRAALERRFGLQAAGDQADDLLALQTKDGRLLPLLPTEGAKFFYLDAANHKRPMQLTVRRYEKTPGLVVIEVHSIRDGKLNEIYYWCGICAIKSYAKEPCECCQLPVELREHPVGENFHKK